jgi:site-specific DNA-cytosine methylase
MIRVLELFSGTGSVSKVCNKLGWESVSVDMILPADHKCDIMDFDYKQYPKDYFQIVWGSPPCVNYSKLQESHLGRNRKGVPFTKEMWLKNMEESDKLVLKTFEIIEYFNPDMWFVENPQTGYLKTRDIMKDKSYYDVDYCMYSNWGYRKRTRVWTNKKDFIPKLCNKKCGNMVDGRHKATLGGRYLDKDNKVITKTIHRYDKYRIPEDLIISLFQE